MPNTTTEQTNNRTWLAVAAVRIERTPATMSELYDALNARYRSRHVELTPDERKELDRQYLKANAPDLLSTL